MYRTVLFPSVSRVVLLRIGQQRRAKPRRAHSTDRKRKQIAHKLNVLFAPSAAAVYGGPSLFVFIAPVDFPFFPFGTGLSPIVYRRPTVFGNRSPIVRARAARFRRHFANLYRRRILGKPAPGNIEIRRRVVGTLAVPILSYKPPLDCRATYRRSVANHAGGPGGTAAGAIFRKRF